MFEPKQFKRLEIDLENGIFQLNGEHLSHCTGLHLDCNIGRDDRYHLHLQSYVEPEFYGKFDANGIRVDKQETKRCKCRGCGKLWHLQDAKFCCECGAELLSSDE